MHTLLGYDKNFENKKVAKIVIIDPPMYPSSVLFGLSLIN